jgi:hypothetical protein
VSIVIYTKGSLRMTVLWSDGYGGFDSVGVSAPKEPMVEIYQGFLS